MVARQSTATTPNENNEKTPRAMSKFVRSKSSILMLKTTPTNNLRLLGRCGGMGWRRLSNAGSHYRFGALLQGERAP